MPKCAEGRRRTVWALASEKEMAKVKIKYVRSAINRPKNQKRTIEALGFKRLNQVIEKEASPQVLGMVKTVSHLLEVID